MAHKANKSIQKPGYTIIDRELLSFQKETQKRGMKDMRRTQFIGLNNEKYWDDSNKNAPKNTHSKIENTFQNIKYNRNRKYIEKTSTEKKQLSLPPLR